MQYSADSRLKKLELHNMDHKIRKTVIVYQLLHSSANVSRLYLLKNEGGKGLFSTEDCLNNGNIVALGQYLKMSQEWLKSS